MDNTKDKYSKRSMIHTARLLKDQLKTQYVTGDTLHYIKTVKRFNQLGRCLSVK